MALTAGTCLGVYEVTAQIGQGGMGEVYWAWRRKATSVEGCLRNVLKAGAPVGCTSAQAEVTASGAGRLCDEERFPGLGGSYEITAQIGVGGMGEVYRATDTTLDRDVALKILPDAFTADPDRLARFEREAKVLASLNHPNIGAIYGLEEAEGTKALGQIRFAKHS